MIKALQITIIVVCFTLGALNIVIGNPAQALACFSAVFVNLV